MQKFNHSGCVESNYIEDETYYLGCNPHVAVSDLNGKAEQSSVSLQCDAGPLKPAGYRALSSTATEDNTAEALAIVPSNGQAYAIEL